MQLRKKIEKELKKTGEDIKYNEFMKKTFQSSAIISICLLIVFYLLYDLQISFFVFLGSFILLFAGKIYKIKEKKEEFAKKLESDLPFALTELALMIEIGTSFNYALRKIANSNYGLLGKEYKKIIKDMEKGKSLEEGLKDFNKKHSSLQLERANSLIANIYSKGNNKISAQSLKILGEEMLSMQKIQAKEFNGKLVVYALMFIVLSAIVPALFQSFLIAGSLVFSMDFSPLEILLIVGGVFPLGNLLMLLYIKGKTPIHLRNNQIKETKEKGFLKTEIKEFEKVLEKRNSNYKKFLKKYLVLGAIISSVLFFAGLQIAEKEIYEFFLFLIASPLIGYFIENYLLERKKQKIEKSSAEVLLQASIFPKGTDTLEIIEHLSKSNLGELSLEFKKAFREIKKGSSIQEALGKIKERCNSRAIDRTIDLLIIGYENGSDMSTVFRETAEDIIKSKEILMERNASMIIEKYTLLFAGAILVPMVLGFLANMITGMDISANILLQASEMQEKKELLEIMKIASPIYIAEYSILASFFVAQQENIPKKAIFYLLIILPLSLISYFFAGSLL